MSPDLGPWAPRYALLAGAGDALTGVFLLATPAMTLRWMGLHGEPSQWVFLRFVGSFVLGVGLSYLYPFVIARQHVGRRLPVVFEVTAVLRPSVASFVYVALALGALEVGWVVVANFDLLLALLQMFWVRKVSHAES